MKYISHGTFIPIDYIVDLEFKETETYKQIAKKFDVNDPSHWNLIEQEPDDEDEDDESEDSKKNGEEKPTINPSARDMKNKREHVLPKYQLLAYEFYQYLGKDVLLKLEKKYIQLA